MAIFDKWMGWFKLFWVSMLPDKSHQVSACWKLLFEEYQDVCLVLISEWNDFIYSEYPCCIPISFCSREYMGWKKLFEKFQECRLVHDHLLYLSEMKEAFMSLFGLKHPIKFLLMRKYGLEEDNVWQISRLLFSSWPSWYLIYSEPPWLPGFRSRVRMVLK